MADDEAVHLNPDSLDKYFRLDAVSIFQLSEKVDALLEIDPKSEQLRLFVPAVGGMPDVDGLERVKVDRITRPGGGSRYRIVLDVAGMHYAGYQLIESIVAYLREGSTFTRAVAESIAVMKDLLANRGRLTYDEETGLWGELTLLEELVSGVGEHSAVASWLGPVASEHDFSLGTFEVEVKTTRGEGRRHVIASDTQLQPSPDVRCTCFRSRSRLRARRRRGAPCRRLWLIFERFLTTLPRSSRLPSTPWVTGTVMRTSTGQGFSSGASHVPT